MTTNERVRLTEQYMELANENNRWYRIARYYQYLFSKLSRPFVDNITPETVISVPAEHIFAYKLFLNATVRQTEVRDELKKLYDVLNSEDETTDNPEDVPLSDSEDKIKDYDFDF